MIFRILITILIFYSEIALSGLTRTPSYQIEEPKFETNKYYLALVVGNASYENLSLLKNPSNEVDEISNELLKIGFHVIRIKNADKVSMDGALKYFSEKLNEKADLGLFYYAGHALSSNNTNYIVPTDAEIKNKNDLRYEAVSINEIIDKMKSSVGIKLIILDACRDDPFSKNGYIASIESGLSEIKTEDGEIYIAFSTSPGGLASDRGKEGENQNLSPFAEAFIYNIKENNDLEVEQLFKKIRARVVEKTELKQRPWSTSSLTVSLYLPTNHMERKSNINENNIIKEFLVSNGMINKNSKNIEFLVNKKYLGNVEDGEILLPNDEDNVLRRGVNSIKVWGKELQVWFEKNKLRFFTNPYKNSYAVIVAIDNYQNTGFENVNFMVKNAESLKNHLMKLGFSKNKIITLYNEDATKNNINSLLENFWDRGLYEDADRVLLYFGGHGDKIDSYKDSNSTIARGYLATYDVNKNKPLQSGILLDDIIGKHFKYVKSNHMIVFLDSCSSGLSLPRFLDKEKDEQDLAEIRKLSVIKSEIDEKARDIIVAGTNDEKAIWLSGGIFTNTLIEALQGEGDTNKDGVIQFGEISTYIKNKVYHEALMMSGRQTPSFYSQEKGGTIFILP